MNRTISIATLVLSIAALGIAICAWFQPGSAKPDPAQVRVLVDAELQRRESDLVAAMKPKLRLVYKDMLGPDWQGDENTFDPKTLFDLFGPLSKIIDRMQSQPFELPAQK